MNNIIVPIIAFPYQTATHCQSTDCWHRPIAGPANWNQLQQQAVSWDSWQRYEGLDWASPVQRGPAGEEGWVLHHWSRVTVMDRFREESWWPRFFSCLDSVWKDGHDGRKASKSNRACVPECVWMCVCVWWVHMYECRFQSVDVGVHACQTVKQSNKCEKWHWNLRSKTCLCSILGQF